VAKLIVLGTANAIPNQRQENTHLLLVGQERTVLVDTSTNPIVRLRQAGIEPLNLTDLILTHFHPDHVSGVPLLLLVSWLLGRTTPLNIYGLAFTLERVEKMMELYGWGHWPNFFPVNFIRLPETEMTLVLQCAEFSVLASPVRHMIPNIGLRVDFHVNGKAFAYSGDTEPAQETAHLAKGVDLLIHEATGAERGHSSAAQAGSIACQAEAGKLVLIHYDAEAEDAQKLIEQAQSIFPGAVELAQDFLVIEF
jgi:ribonuclease Z